MLNDQVRNTFAVLTEVHIGVIHHIGLMIGPGPLTHFIPYVLYGVHDRGKSRPRIDVDVILCKEVCRYTCFVRPCIVLLENARPHIQLWIFTRSKNR